VSAISYAELRAGSQTRGSLDGLSRLELRDLRDLYSRTRSSCNRRAELPGLTERQRQRHRIEGLRVELDLRRVESALLRANQPDASPPVSVVERARMDETWEQAA
jgi:hypothetical protein